MANEKDIEEMAIVYQRMRKTEQRSIDYQIVSEDGIAKTTEDSVDTSAIVGQVNKIRVEQKELEKLQNLHREQVRNNRERFLDRKMRTRRLIQHGAIVEALVPGSEVMTPDEFKQALQKRLNLNDRE